MKKGISLIVLVITVIVLAILASAVIINMSGNSNIINEADEAVNEYNLKQYDQKLSLAYASWLAEEDNRGLEFTTANLPDLAEHGFDTTTDVPAGYRVTVVNKVPVLSEIEE